MNELELIKAFAEIEGVKVELCEAQDGHYFISKQGEYNPITYLALNCAARDKYCVEASYYSGNEIELEIFDNDCAVIQSKWVNSKEEIPRAVIECIVKANKQRR